MGTAHCRLRRGLARRSAAPPSPATAPHLRLSGEQLQPRSRDTHSPGVGTQGQRCSPGPRRSPAPGPGGGGGARATPNPHPGAEQCPARAPAYCTGHCRTGPDPRAGHLTVGCPRSDGERKSRAADTEKAWPGPQTLPQTRRPRCGQGRDTAGLRPRPAPGPLPWLRRS